MSTACFSERTTLACQVGTERCECYGNATCNEGLACYSNRCVRPENSGGATSTATSDPAAGSTSDPVGSGGARGGSTGSGGASGSSTTQPSTGGAAQGGATGGASSDGGVSSGGALSGGSGGVASGGTSAGGGAGMTGTGKPNLLSNGDFSAGEAHWKTEPLDGNQRFSVNAGAGQYCVRTEAGMELLISYPAAGEPGLTLEEGKTYVLTLRARSSAQLTFGVKVGQAEPPYTAAADKGENIADTTQKSYGLEFSQKPGLGAMGLAFTARFGAGQELCIDDVHLSASDP